MQNMPGGKTSVLGLDSNLAALLCYVLSPCCFIGVVLSLIFFFTEKNNRFVRFHAVQALLIFALAFVVSLVLGIFGVMLTAMHLEGLGYAVLGLRGLIGLVFLGILIYAGVQAYQNNMTKLPVIGDLAEKFSN